MDSTILTAIIAAGSACLGAFVPSYFSYRGKQKEFDNARNAKLEEIRREEYKLYLEALQTMINAGEAANIDHFLPIQFSTNRLLLYAGPKVTGLVNKYFTDVTQRIPPLSPEEHKKFQTDIVNAMREELGVSKEELESVTIVSARF